MKAFFEGTQNKRKKYVYFFVCFGIADDGKVVGIADIDHACLDIKNKINDSISPIPDYRISIDYKTNVITLEVAEGNYKPYYYKSKAYKRNDTATIEVDRLERIGKSSSQIAQSVGFGKNKILNLLTFLIQKGYASKTGLGRGTRYLAN